METAKVPTHVAIIMDGNGRWAIARHLPRLAGHRAGVENLRRIITACVEFGVRHLTIYAFSTENWGRPREEVDGLLFILNEVLDKELGELNKQGVQLRHIGRLEALSPGLQKKVRGAMELTRHNDRLVLNVEAIAYHEGIPGHHLQLSLAQEMQNLPAFRRYAGYTAFVEGWALYSERLGKEVGRYQDPYSDYGRLENEIHRAAEIGMFG